MTTKAGAGTVQPLRSMSRTEPAWIRKPTARSAGRALVGGGA
ncbi:MULTISPECIES: hypothetical protein [Streptomyces]|nr:MULTISPECIES: hypothetical protein [Streptomyces]